MAHYWVATPEFPKYGNTYFDGYEEPPEYGRDVVCIEARTKREAKVLAVRKMSLDHYCKWVEYQRSDGRSPFTGLEVTSAVCEHGFCGCECERNDGDHCEQCEAEYERGARP